jgi:hypothetical protein
MAATSDAPPPASKSRAHFCGALLAAKQSQAAAKAPIGSLQNTTLVLGVAFFWCAIRPQLGARADRGLVAGSNPVSGGFAGATGRGRRRSVCRHPAAPLPCRPAGRRRGPVKCGRGADKMPRRPATLRVIEALKSGADPLDRVARFVHRSCYWLGTGGAAALASFARGTSRRGRRYPSST